jgi:adenylyl-sulfate kinase
MSEGGAGPTSGSVVLWFTGLSGAGKTTLARGVEAALWGRGRDVRLLDGDELRRTLSADLGFSRADRDENVRRIAALARREADAGQWVIVAAISPYVAQRLAARRSCQPHFFVEIHVATPLTVCEARDPKGLYARARRGELPGFTGIDDPYEPPTPDAPAEVVTHTTDRTPETTVDELLQRIGALVELGAVSG